MVIVLNITYRLYGMHYVIYTVNIYQLLCITYLSYFAMSEYQPKLTQIYLNSKSFVEQNFNAQILDRDSELWSSIMGSYLIYGYKFDVIRFKCPELYSQTGFNSETYRGFIIYAKVAEWDEARPKDLVLEENAVADQSELNWYFKSVIRFWFCSCRNGQR